MNWIKVFFRTLLFALVDCSVPQGSLPDNPTFAQYINHLDVLFEDSKRQKIDDCAYTTAKIVLTLNNDVNEGHYKYKLIFDEMKIVFDEMRSDLKTNHISAMEPIINRALSVIIRDHKELVLKFLDEALVVDNPFLRRIW